MTMVEEHVIENGGHTAGGVEQCRFRLREDKTGASADRGGVGKNIRRMK